MPQSFSLALLGPWTAGSILAGVDDHLPLTAFRRLDNMRLDRVAGAITPRPGSTLLTSAISATRLNGQWLSRLFGLTTTFGYAQFADATSSELFRFNSAWGGATSLGTTGLDRIFSSSMLDGDNTPWIIMVGPLLRKDNGTSLQTLGIPAPVTLPTVTLGTRERQAIWSFDTSFASWAATGVTAVADEPNIKQEGAGSMRVSVAADTLATLTLGLGNPRSLVNGTHNGVGNSPDLVDTTKNFVTRGVKRDSLVTNTTKTINARVLNIITTTNPNDTLVLQPGQDWDVGDAYEVHYNLDTFEIVVDAGTDNSGVVGNLTRVKNSTKDFLALGVVPGMIVWNTSNGTRGVVSAITTSNSPNDSLICAAGFSGSTENDFDTGDGYIVVNELVKDDDYVHLWVRADRLDRVEYVQIDFDTTTTAAASAFQTDYYSLRVSGSELNQGNDVWTELFLAKSRFTRVGTVRDWREVKAIRLSIQTSVDGAAVLYFDDLSLVGGYGIEGDIEYTMFYRNEVTKGRGSPLKQAAFDGSEIVLYTQKLKFKRHPGVINTTAIANPSDAQINQFCIARRGGNLTQARLVVRLADSTTTYTDKRSDLELLNAELLEEDNDPPPADTHTVFGPGGLNRHFYVAGRNRVYPSKIWEEDESRSENVPSQGYFTVGDGSTRAMHGIVEGAMPFLWTQEGKYQIQGIGPDTFLPLRVDGSRGLAARDALTSGDGRMWTLAKDGIIEHRGIQEEKITSAIDPFFLGQTIHGVLPIDQARISECSLRWYEHPQTPLIVLFYRESSTGTMKRLTCKRNVQTTAYTDIFFDYITGVNCLSGYFDPVNNTLLSTTDDARIAQIEVDTATTDGGIAIPMVLQTVADTRPSPRQEKQYESIVADAQTNGESLTVSALYDRAEVTQALGTFSTTSAVGQSILRTNAVTKRRNIALKVTGAVTSLIKLYHLGWHVLVEPEAVTWMDTSALTLEKIHYAKRLSVDIDAPADITVTVYRDGVAQDSRTIPATTGRQRLPVLLPASQKARGWRVTCSSTEPFRLYQLAILMKPLGMPDAFSERPIYPAA